MIALIYGSNFVTLKYLDSIQLDVSIITAIRFFLASVALAPFLFKQSLEVLLAGLEIGLWVSIGYITQAIGLETTQASKRYDGPLRIMSILFPPTVLILIFQW